ncbi:MAG: uracil-DNA glycosylase [Candidatus Ratteibacteria bacterium]|nr:uracil-DNA glycosylase [Candidatus Ratteibacteria bacterium]
MQNLDDIAKEVRTCKKCHLHKTRTNAVPGEGNSQAEIMFIGEAPGYHEDIQGRPFVGQAGKLLDNLLKGIGLERKNVFIGNIIKCRPPGNRDPQPEEINTCISYLLKQIEIIKPKVICTLGRFSFAEMMQRKVFISSEHGRPFKTGSENRLGEGLNIFPLYHPAAALHQPGLIDALEEDFKKLHAFLTSPPPENKVKENPLASVYKKTNETPQKKEKQLGLF